MTKKKASRSKGRLLFKVTDKFRERIFTKMLKNLKMNIIIKNANDIESGTVYPIVALDIRSNSVTYLDGETEKTISTLRVVAIDIDADDPTIVCVKSEENHASEV